MSATSVQRLDRLRELLRARELEGLLIACTGSHDPDLQPFVGGQRLGECLLGVSTCGRETLLYFTEMEREVAAATGWQVLRPAAAGLEALHRKGASEVECWTLALEAVLGRLSLDAGRVALAGHAELGTLWEAAQRVVRSLPELQLVAGHGLVRGVRRKKTASEVREIRRAAAASGDAFRSIAGTLHSARETQGSRDLVDVEGPLTVGRLRRIARALFWQHGLSEPQGSLVAAGEEGATPHNVGNDERVIRGGESIVVDLFPRGGLFSDCTRTFCVGEPSPALAAASAEVLAALSAARQRCRAGTKAYSLQELVCEHFERKGYATHRSQPGTLRGYVHGLGHGVGYELHEAPSFRDIAEAEAVIEEGDVLTLEPGLYDPEAGWAVRFEDLFLVHASDAAVPLERLTELPLSLDPAAYID